MKTTHTRPSTLRLLAAALALGFATDLCASAVQGLGRAAWMLVALALVLALPGGTLAAELALAASDRLTLEAGETLSGGLTVASGATLAGAGTLDGAATVEGLLDPGMSHDVAGTLTLAGGLSLASSATLRVHLFADGSSDCLVGTGEAFALGGALRAVVPSGYAAGNRTFTIATNTTAHSGAFTNITDGSVSAYLADDSLAGLDLGVAFPGGLAISLADLNPTSKGSVFRFR